MNARVRARIASVRVLGAGLIVLAGTLPLALSKAPAAAAAIGIPGPGGDRLTGTPGPDVLDGGRGHDVLRGRAGDDVLTGGPGYDGLYGGPGNDLLVDESDGSNLLDGGPGDDTIRSGPRGMDRVRCGPGGDRVEADLWDIVAPDCEEVVRSPAPVPARGGPLRVESLSGKDLGTTLFPLTNQSRDPLRLLWVNDGVVYLSSRFRGNGHCFIAVAAGSGARVECGFSPRRGLRPRRIEGDRYRWFAFVPGWVTHLSVAGRRVEVRGGVGVFTARRDPGTVVARGQGRAVVLRVP
ncbi:MAG: hypothetical protein AB7I38_16795 [Dehalococcoidia bacterium]